MTRKWKIAFQSSTHELIGLFSILKSQVGKGMFASVGKFQSLLFC